MSNPLYRRKTYNKGRGYVAPLPQRRSPEGDDGGDSPSGVRQTQGERCERQTSVCLVVLTISEAQFGFAKIRDGRKRSG